MGRGRRQSDREEQSVLIRLTRGENLLFESEIKPGHHADLGEGLRLDVLWIRTHQLAPNRSPTKDKD